MNHVRNDRCLAMGIDPNLWRAWVDHTGPLTTVVSSRLGHDPVRHRTMARHLAESMLAFSRDQSTLLIAEGTAIESWAKHAANAFRVPTIVLPDSPDRDRLLLSIPDRIDAVYVRSKGKMKGLIEQRLSLNSGTVHVAVDPHCGDESKTARQLLTGGAIGRFLINEMIDDESTTSNFYDSMDSLDWNEFLVHCTRSTLGPWSGQSMPQYRDDMLLGDWSTASRDATAAVCRIVRQRRLRASAIVSDHQYPVVCFSLVPLPELLKRRTYRSHLHRWDYEPHGIAIARSAAERIGIVPVLYGDADAQSRLNADQRFRFQSRGAEDDWSNELEWRSDSDVNLDAIDPEHIRVFTSNRFSAEQISRWNSNRWRIITVGG